MSLLRFLGEPEFRPARDQRPAVISWPYATYRRVFRWRTRALALALLIGLAGGLALGSQAAATSRSEEKPTTLMLSPIDVSRPAERTSAPPPSRRPEPVGTPGPAATSPEVGSPPPASGGSLSGTATWYCSPGRSPCTRGYPGGLYAAAGPALRAALGDWRGRQVTVSAGGRSVTVMLIDWCACGSGRVIDLYGEAFARLAPLSRGVLTVTLTW